MSDPFSVAGSIAGLVSLAIQLSQVSYQYVASVKGSSKAWSSYIQELSALTSVLLQLQTAGEVQERGTVLAAREPSVSIEAVSACVGELQQLKAKLDGKLAKRGVMGKVDALVWPFSEADTQKKVDSLHRYRDVFSSALLADSFTVSIASYRELRNQRQENEFSKVLDWFRPLSPPQQAAPISEQRCPGTGSSFLGNKAYRDWREGPLNCLWASGQPGAGKTVLSSAVLDDLRPFGSKDAVMAYHFFRVDNSEDSLQNLLRHLVFQGLRQCKNILPEALEVHKKQSTSNAEPLPKDLVRILTAVSKASPVMYVVLDGLDECQYLSKLGRHLPVLRFSGMKILITSRDLPDIRKHLENWCQVDVRPDRDDILRYVDWRLCEDAEMEYDLLGNQFKEEIASKLLKHVDGSFLLVRLMMDHIGGLTTIKKIRKFLEDLPSDYEEAYQCTFDRIMKQNAGRRELALKAISWVTNTKRPLTMRELQHAMAAEDCGDIVSDEDLESPKSILSSCVGLLRLSKVDQRVEFIHSSARSFIQSNQENIDPDADMTIGQACLAYLSQTEMTNGPCVSLQDFARRLQLLPFLEYAAGCYGYHIKSVEQRCLPELRQFLGNEKLREGSWQALHFGFNPHHALGLDIFSGLPSHASTLHVASYWDLSHCLAAILEDSRPAVRPTLAEVDAPDSHGWTPLHWAASMGQLDSAKLLLRFGASVDSLDSAQWTPLFWAAFKGHHDMASLLLSRGSNVQQVDSDGMTPLHWSISAGQDDTTNILMGLMENDDIKRPSGYLALRKLKNRERLSIAEAKRIVAPYTTSESLVQLSAERLDSKAFSKFMQSTERKAQRMDFYYDWSERIPSIEPLFRTLWRVKQKGGLMTWRSMRKEQRLAKFQATLLERAIEDECVPLVEALLDLYRDKAHNINEDILHGTDDYYIYLACTRRNPDIATAFIMNGADMSRHSRMGHTPLHYACEAGSSDVVKVILGDDRVKVDAKDDDGSTSLIELLQSGSWRTRHHPEENLEICKALIAHGASIHELDKFGNTTAKLAIRLWDPAVLQLLVDSGACFGQTKKDGMTPFYIAASAPFQRSIKRSPLHRRDYEEAGVYQIPSAAIQKTLELVLSIADAADMTLTSRVGQGSAYEETALARAISAENWVVARRLHELGARFETNRPLYPLIIQATSAGIPELVRLLIKSGADVNLPQTESNGQRCYAVPICVAVRLAAVHDTNQNFFQQAPNYLATGDYGSVVRVLADAGADISRTDGFGKTALEYAVRHAVASDILQTLLDAGSDPYTPTTNGFDYFQLALLQPSLDNLYCLWEYRKAHPAPLFHWLHPSYLEVGLGEQANPVRMFVLALSQACAIDTRDKYGHTLLFNAAMAGNHAVAQELIIYGANVNDSDSLGWTPLHAAVSRRDAVMTTILLEASADINGTLTDEIPWRPDRFRDQNSRDTYKAIHLALSKLYHYVEDRRPPSPEVVWLLLNSGADLSEAATYCDSRRTTFSKTPIQLLFENISRRGGIEEADFKRMLEIAEMLVQRGVAVGDVALDLTVENVIQFEGHEELWETLRKGMEDAKMEMDL